MENEQNHQPQMPPQYLTLQAIARFLGVPYHTLRLKVSCAKKQGIALPPRKRIGKTYLYDVHLFCEWLWQYGDQLGQPTEHLASLSASAVNK